MSPKVFLQFLIGDVVLMIYSRFYKKLVMIIIMKFSFWFRNAIFFCIPQNKYLQIKISSMNCGNELPIVCMFQRNLDFAPVKIQFDWLQMETDRLHHSNQFCISSVPKDFAWILRQYYVFCIYKWLFDRISSMKYEINANWKYIDFYFAEKNVLKPGFFLI